MTLATQTPAEQIGERSQVAPQHLSSLPMSRWTPEGSEQTQSADPAPRSFSVFLASFLLDHGPNEARVVSPRGSYRLPHEKGWLVRRLETFLALSLCESANSA